MKMMSLVAALVVTVGLLPQSAPAADSACEIQANTDGLTGAARATFLRNCEREADVHVTCEQLVIEKNLAGAALANFMHRCRRDAGDAFGACDKSAGDKSLRGTARASHVRQCLADRVAAAGK